MVHELAAVVRCTPIPTSYRSLRLGIGCRQRLAEFSDPGTLIHLCDAEGVKKTVRMDELLPLAFQTETIG